MWDNYGLFHSAVDYPLKYGSRSMHQANIGKYFDVNDGKQQLTLTL